MRTRVQKLPVPSWGSWMVDMNLPKNHIKPGRRRALSAGGHEILRSHNGVPLQRKQSSVDCLPEENYKPVEKNVISNDRNGENLSERDQPVEEPWLLRSILVSMMDFVGLDEASDQDKVHKNDFPGRFPDAEVLAPEDDHGILITRFNRIGVSKKIKGIERTRLKVIAKSLQPPGFGLTVRTVAAGHSLEELQKDLDGLFSTWKSIVEHAKSAALAAQEGVEGAVPVMLHKAMGQTLSVVQDYFNENVKSMVVDSPRTYHEITSYLQEIAPDLCNRVELYDRRTPIFDEFNIEEEINNILSKRVPLSNGGSLVIEQTEALVSIDVNGGHSMLGQGTSQEKAILDVNLAAAKQIARELRLRDIGGIIVVDFIDMVDDSNRRLVYEEMKKATERDRSAVRVSELSKLGLMEITRKRVRPSVTFMISEPCSCCHATGRVEALETSFSKIEREICRFLAVSNQRPDPENPKSWPRFVLRVDRYMCNYLTSGKRTKLAVLSSSLKVWILLKVARGFSRGTYEVKPFAEDKANDEQQVAISRLRPTEAGTYFPSSKLTLFPVKKWKTRGK
ncbi:hypothetical protein COCNU_11G011290 [Cocos nucifera]|uniref:RNA-binding protein AU-1/Ribonuclease E/G domain-containing protein n=1 Tax=Cocos nucifera TaxID=13894 RepID=A0A8K0IPZ8_COCNU|nr:hypothetical protein COCNU_11G011290 [Cocos nucifera]